MIRLQLISEMTYKVLIQSEPCEKNDLHAYLIIHGQHNQTSKLSMKDFNASHEKNECQLKAIDVGKVSLSIEVLSINFKCKLGFENYSRTRKSRSPNLMACGKYHH